MWGEGMLEEVRDIGRSGWSEAETAVPRPNAKNVELVAAGEWVVHATSESTTRTTARRL